MGEEYECRLEKLGEEDDGADRLALSCLSRSEMGQ